MSPLEAAALIRDQMKDDPDLRRALTAMVERSEHDDLYEWCEANQDEAVALAEQLVDINGQISNMSYLLSQGDLS